MRTTNAEPLVNGLSGSRRRGSIAVGLASLAIALGLAACGSSSAPAANSGTTPTTAPVATTAPTTAPTSAPTTTQCTIPQSNGGDHDADNNGGPSDGDGCL
jgi:hypothetical protein